MVKRIGFYLAASIIFMTTMMAMFSVFYHYTEGLSWLDSFYFTVITTRTIGFGDISPQTAVGKMGTIINALLPATVFLGTSLVVLNAVMNHLENQWKRFRMKSNKKHDIIVADVDLLESIVTEYELKNKPFVVISRTDLDSLPRPLQKKLNESSFLSGDATHDDVLEHAQIVKANSIIIATSDDNFNMYVLVTARSLAPGLKTIVRVNRHDTESKFRSVGADILLPAATVLGRMLSEAAVSPIAHNFLVALHTQTTDPFFEEFAADPSQTGRPVREIFPDAIAMHRDGRYCFDLASYKLQAGDTVLSIKMKYI